MYLTIDSSRKVKYSILRPHSSVTKTESIYPPSLPLVLCIKYGIYCLTLLLFVFFCRAYCSGNIGQLYIWISRGSVYPWTWSGLLVGQISDSRAINCTLRMSVYNGRVCNLSWCVHAVMLAHIWLKSYVIWSLAQFQVL